MAEEGTSYTASVNGLFAGGALAPRGRPSAEGDDQLAGGTPGIDGGTSRSPSSRSAPK